MALITCKECKAQVSDTAEKCPSCGAKVKKPTSPFTWFVVFCIVVWVIVGIQPKGKGNAAEQASDSPSSASAGVEVSNWKYSEKHDKFNENLVRFAEVRSLNAANLNMPFAKNSHAKIELENSKKDGLRLFLEVDNGQFNCGFEGCEIRVRFDDQKPRNFSAELPTDGHTTYVFVHSAGSFVKAMKKSKKVSFEAEYFQAGHQAFEFDVDGFDAKKLGL